MRANAWRRCAGSLRQIASRTYLREFLAHYLGGLYRRAGEHHLFLMGGGLAFSLLMCIVPLALIVFAVLGQILELSVRGQLEAFVYAVIPYENQAAFVQKVLVARASDFVLYKGVYGVVGGLGLLFAASGLFSSMRTLLNAIYRVQESRTEIKGKLRDFGMVFLVLVFFMGSIIFLPALEALKDSFLADALLVFFEMAALTALQKFLYSLTSALAVFAAFFVLYGLVPYGKQGRKVVALSAFWAALLWEIAKQIFGYYITHVASIQRIYGAYVLVVVVAIWIYYSSIVFILAAAIGQLYKERRQEREAVVFLPEDPTYAE